VRGSIRRDSLRSASPPRTSHRATEQQLSVGAGLDKANGALDLRRHRSAKPRDEFRNLVSRRRTACWCAEGRRQRGARAEDYDSTSPSRERSVSSASTSRPNANVLAVIDRPCTRSPRNPGLDARRCTPRSATTPLYINQANHEVVKTLVERDLSPSSSSASSAACARC